MGSGWHSDDVRMRTFKRNAASCNYGFNPAIRTFLKTLSTTHRSQVLVGQYRPIHRRNTDVVLSPRSSQNKAFTFPAMRATPPHRMAH